MITRIEIDGFKSFRNFGVDLKPFQVFLGPNGVGKTNLFDAIVLLSNLAGDNTVEDALQKSRGEISELFTFDPDGTRAHRMSLAVEMLVGRTVTENAGKTLNVGSTRLRYELELENRAEDGVERVFVARENLLPIQDASDKWVKANIPTRNRKPWIAREKRPPYIATVEDKEKGGATIYRNQDVPGGGREAFSVGQLDSTVLSSSNGLRYPNAYAARQEMLNWRFLQLNPFALRTRPDKQNSAALLPDGSNLVAVLARISRENEAALKRILADLTKIVPEFRQLSVKAIPGRDDSLIEVETQDGSRFSSRVLSDGTLRLLTLVTLKNDPQHRGVLCFEEPENGVQPMRLRQIVEVLHSLATNFEQDGDSGPLRQVLINTHSPGLLTSVPADSLFFVNMKMHEKKRETRIIPVQPVLLMDEQEQYYTWEQVKSLLEYDKTQLPGS